MFRKQDLTQMGFLLHFVFFLPIKNVLSCLDGEDMSLCLYVAFITSCHFILLICSPIPIVTPVNFTFLFSPLRLSFNVEDLCCFEARKIFRFSVQKSVSMRVLRGVCRKFRSIWKRYSNFFYLPFLVLRQITQTLPRNTLPEIMLTVYQVFFQVRLYPVKAKL